MSEIERRSPERDGSGPRPVAVVIVGLAASAIIAVAAIGLLAPRDVQSEERGQAPPTDVETPAPVQPTFTAPSAASPEEATAVADAAEAAQSLVAASNTMLARGDGTLPDISAIASGFVAGELEALAAERAALGFRQIGDATITSVAATNIDLAGDPQSMLLEVCIDASGIDVVDENGASLRNALYNTGTPVLHHYGAQRLDGHWKLTTHEIPTNGLCP